MSATTVMAAVLLCAVGLSTSSTLRKAAEALANRQPRMSDNLVLPTVSPSLNPGDAGVQEWPDKFRPDIESAFELLRKPRHASADEGSDQKPSTNPFGIPPSFEQYTNPITSMAGNFGNTSSYGEAFTKPMGSMMNTSSIGSYVPQNLTSMGGNNPFGNMSLPGGGSGNPIENFIPNTSASQITIPFINQNNNNNNAEGGDKPSKRSADYASQIPSVDYNKPLSQGMGTLCNSISESAKE